jgi:hypothetical protein
MNLLCAPSFLVGNKIECPNAGTAHDGTSLSAVSLEAHLRYLLREEFVRFGRRQSPFTLGVKGDDINFGDIGVSEVATWRFEASGTLTKGFKLSFPGLSTKSERLQIICSSVLENESSLEIIEQLLLMGPELSGRKEDRGADPQSDTSTFIGGKVLWITPVLDDISVH